jgi:hypothetical protein
MRKGLKRVHPLYMTSDWMSDRLFLDAAAAVLVGWAAGAIGRSHAHPVTG